MIPEINYYSPVSIDEAIKLLAENEQAQIIAGGTDVLTGFHQESSRFINTKVLIDINNISELHQITENETEIRIGAGCPFSTVVNSELIQKHFPLLAEASSGVGSLQIRNRATIAGNFVNNAPCADSVPALLVYDAKIGIQSPAGSHILPLQDFLIKPYKTQLTSKEIVTDIYLQKLPVTYQGSFYKLGRRRGVAISRITVAALLQITNNVFTDFRLAGGAITPIGMRFPEIEAMALQQEVTDALLRNLAIATGKLVLERTGLRWSTAYKLPVLQQLCYQELVKAVKGKE